MQGTRTVSCGLFALIVLFVVGAGVLWAQPETPPGKKALSEAGCVMCHGPSGRGAKGPSLIPVEFDFAAFTRIVREGIGEMPGQAEENVTDEQIVLIYEYVVSMSQSSNRR